MKEYYTICTKTTADLIYTCFAKRLETL